MERLKCEAPNELVYTKNYNDIPENIRKDFEVKMPKGLPCDGGFVTGEWCISRFLGGCVYLEKGWTLDEIE